MIEFFFDILAVMLFVWTAAALGLTVFLAYVLINEWRRKR